MPSVATSAHCDSRDQRSPRRALAPAVHQPRREATGLRRRCAVDDALAQQRKIALDVTRHLGFGGGGLQLALPRQLGLAARALGEMGIDARALIGIERRADVPRQQGLHRLVDIAEGNDLPAHSQSSSRPASKVFKRRRAWNMRVFTVSTGQPTISAISR